MDNKVFGEFIKSRRKKLHLSQSFIAGKLGYTTQIVSTWERGLTFPIMSCWNDLMEILQIDINGLIKCKPIYKIKDRKFDEKKFIFNLKDLRLNKGLTQIELATKLKVNNKTISSWENNTSLPSMEDFINLAQIYNVSYADLYYGEHIQEEQEQPIITKRNKTWLTVLLSSLAVIAVISGITLPILLTSKERNHINYLTSESEAESSFEPSDTSSPITSEDISSTSSTDDGSNSSEEIPPIVYTLNLFEQEIIMKISETMPLEYEVDPLDASIIWESSNPDIVSVSNGVVKANKYGEAIITATIENDPTVFDSIKIRCKYESSEQYQSFMECDEEAFEFMYPSKKKVAKFYFEDKKTVIHEELFDPADDFGYNFPEPVFGPLKGWNYEFKGWDIDGDDIPDELPENLAKDTDFYAVYEKTATSERDFVLFDGYKNCANSIIKEYEIYIVPSDSYFGSLEPSEMYTVTEDFARNYNAQVSYLIPMYGFGLIWFGNIFANVTTLRFQSSITGTRAPYSSKVTIDGGYISGGLETVGPVFQQGITNKYLRIENKEGNHFDKDIFSECSNVECIMFTGSDLAYWHEGCFNGLSCLKTINTKENKKEHSRYTDLSVLNDTSITYLDYRGFVEGGFFAPMSEEITLLIPTLLDNTMIQFDDSKAYNILVGFYDAPLTTQTLVGEQMLEKANLKFYYYSEEQVENGWHFNDYGFPTNTYK